jgi:hypothetical protein
MDMTTNTNPEKPAPSTWALGLLAASSGFALLALLLFATGYSPY